jgi:hypothetical protein
MIFQHNGSAGFLNHQFAYSGIAIALSHANSPGFPGYKISQHGDTTINNQCRFRRQHLCNWQVCAVKWHDIRISRLLLCVGADHGGLLCPNKAI